jgi:hypothetical protein
MAEGKSLSKLILVIVGITFLLALPRFKHYVAPDSTHYVELASYFAGDLAKEELRTPFTYRVLVPFLAAIGPTNSLDLNFAIINILFTAGAFIVFYFYLQELLNDPSQINIGLLLLIVAFPTVNYASGVMTDAAGFFFFVLATYFFQTNRYLSFTVTLTCGVLARDAVLVLVIALIVYQLISYTRGPRYERQPWLFLAVVPPLLIYIGIRAFFSDLPSFFWNPSWRQFMFTVSRPVAWATFLLTLLPPLLFLSLAYRRQTVPTGEVLAKWSFHTQNMLVSLTAAGIALNIYSITSAALSGRFVWPFYVVLVPLAAAYFRDDGSLIFRVSGSVADKLFGSSPKERE